MLEDDFPAVEHDSATVTKTMSAAVCFFRDIFYCWQDSFSSVLEQCQVSVNKNLVTTVCLCDHGRLTRPSSCVCPLGMPNYLCESRCADNHNCQVQSTSELSDYVKVLLGIVTIVFFVTFYVLMKKFVCRDRQQNHTTSSTAVNTVINANCYAQCTGGACPHMRPLPPSYDEVNSVPPPYDSVVKPECENRTLNRHNTGDVQIHTITVDNNHNEVQPIIIHSCDEVKSEQPVNPNNAADTVKCETVINMPS